MIKKYIFVFVFISFSLSHADVPIYGSTYGVEKSCKENGWKKRGVKISKESGLVCRGDIIDFEIRGGEKGKLEVFNIMFDENNNIQYIFGYDIKNKLYREFLFPL